MTTPNPVFVQVAEVLIGAAIKSHQRLLAEVLEQNKTAPLAVWPAAFMEGKASLEQLLADVRAGRVANVAQVKERLQALIDQDRADKIERQSKRKGRPSTGRKR